MQDFRPRAMTPTNRLHSTLSTTSSALEAAGSAIKDALRAIHVVIPLTLIGGLGRSPGTVTAVWAQPSARRVGVFEGWGVRGGGTGRVGRSAERRRSRTVVFNGPVHRHHDHTVHRLTEHTDDSGNKAQDQKGPETCQTPKRKQNG